VNRIHRVAWSLARAGVALALVVTVPAACDAGTPSGHPSPDPAGPATGTGSPAPEASPRPAPMPEVPLRYMYARGAAGEGVLVSAEGATETGRRASAYVPTRTGAVFASGDRVYDLADGGPAVAIGPVRERSVFLQVDPTLRYVAWEVRRPDGVHARALVYDVVARRMVLDRVLLWGDRTGPLRSTGFGAARLRLVHLPRWGFWMFATVSGPSGHTLVTPGGQTVDLRSRRVEGPRVSRGLWSPGLRYRAAEARGRRPWQVVDLVTGRDVTPAALLGSEGRATRLTGWLGTTTFGVLTSSGTWRHSALAAAVCHVAGRCREVWRVHLGAEDSGLSWSNEVG
jgi:hypothetical protein